MDEASLSRKGEDRTWHAPHFSAGSPFDQGPSIHTVGTVPTYSTPPGCGGATQPHTHFVIHVGDCDIFSLFQAQCSSSRNYQQLSATIGKGAKMLTNQQLGLPRYCNEALDAPAMRRHSLSIALLRMGNGNVV